MNLKVNYKLIFIKNHITYQRPIEKDYFSHDKDRILLIEKGGGYKYDKDTKKLNKQKEDYAYMYNLKSPIGSWQTKGQDLTSGSESILIRIKGTGNKFYLIKENQEQKLKIKAGKSHPFLFKVANDINLFPISRNQIIVQAKNKDRLRALINILKIIKKPDKYKNKGIHIN